MARPSSPARFLLGLGCAAGFMSAVVLCARWHAGEGLTTALARVFALSQCGILLAGAPFAAVADSLAGAAPTRWRPALTLLGGVLWWRLVRDDPPGVVPPRRAETLAEALRGQVTVWRTPGLLPILSMHLVGYAVHGDGARGVGRPVPRRGPRPAAGAVAARCCS